MPRFTHKMAIESRPQIRRRHLTLCIRSLIVTHPTSSSSTSVAAAAAAANVNVTTSAPSGGQWRDKHDITQRRICYSLHCCRHHQSTQRDAIGAPTCCLPDQGRLDIGSISRRPWPDPTKQSRLCRVWLAV